MFFSNSFNIMQSRYLNILPPPGEQIYGDQCEKAAFSFLVHWGFYFFMTNKKKWDIHNVLLLNIKLFFKNQGKQFTKSIENTLPSEAR